MSKRQITIKPTCMREILAFPADQVSQLWDKINLLVTDPVPDGKLKKKLKTGASLYRLRVGDYRVLYQFGGDWVSLLGIRRRTEDTYTKLPVAGAPTVTPDFDGDLDAYLAKPTPTFTLAKQDGARKLPFPITARWLTSLGIPAYARSSLLHCNTEDDLLALALPDEILGRVLDAMFPPDIGVVQQQPDLFVPSTDDLVRFKEGDLLAFLLKLDDEQRALTNWALNGPTMIRGGAGTGKSTVAMFRVKAVLERATATGAERLLFTTYTRALLAATQQLLAQLLTTEQMKRVRVASCDQIAREIVSTTRRVGEPPADAHVRQKLAQLRSTFEPPASTAFEARVRARALARLSDMYLLEEFDWIMTGRGLSSEAEYLSAPRPGRGVAFPERLRRSVWALYEEFHKLQLRDRFAELRREALAIVRRPDWAGHWDFVFVDEAQDLSPTGLALLAETCRSPEGLFFAADSKQSLYLRNYSWSMAHPRLQFKGRSATLARNYRSTKEIDAAAFSVLRAEEGEEMRPSSSLHDGPMPILLRGVGPDDEASWVARFVKQMSRHLHVREGAAAVLVPSADIGRAMATELAEAGLPATFFTGRDLDLKSTDVKVLTMHSAKGLEFPIVAVAGLHDGTYVLPEDFEDPGLYAERTRHERRLLYVALTRAMRGLMLVVPKDCRHSTVVDLDSAQWHVEEA